MTLCVYTKDTGIYGMQQIQVVKRKQSRYSKGAVIAASRRILKVHGEESWLVESGTTDGKFYKITENGECECADSKYRHELCKHAYTIFRRATT
jgi:hypothetical protein